MKYYLTTCLAIATFGTLFSQNRTLVNGKEYYVYPYQAEIESPVALFRSGMAMEEIIHRDSLNRNIVSVETLPIEDGINLFADPAMKPYKKLILELRKKAPNLLMGSNFSLETDVTPYLQPLPDGEYVQFYRDIPYIDQKTMRYRNDIVCATFFLKNNLLDGNAIWYTLSGDTMKFGRFEQGKKIGPWVHHSYGFNPPQKNAQVEKFLDKTYQVRRTTKVRYVDGLLDGEMSNALNDTIEETGHFKNGKHIGEWKTFRKKTVGYGLFEVTTNELVMNEHYSLVEKPQKSKGVIIRNQTVDSRLMYSGDYEFPEEEMPYSMYEFYTLYQEIPEEGLELPGENVRSYPGEEQDEMYDFENMMAEQYNDAGEISFDRKDNKEKFFLNGKEFTRNQLIDSIGYSTRFTDVYEKYYRNGQLMMRFQIVDGVIHEPDTIYWNTGAPCSIVHFNPETKQYTESVRDLQGKIIQSRIYDEKGNFLKDEKEIEAKNIHQIKGRKYEADVFDQFFSYYDEATFDTVVTAPFLEYDILWKTDTTVAARSEFNPQARSKKHEEYTIEGKLAYAAIYNFNEDYSAFSGTRESNYGNLRQVVHMNGSYYVNTMRPEETNDSLLTRHAQNIRRKFEITEEPVLYVDGQPFSGKFQMDSHASKFSFKSTPGLISISNGLGASAYNQMYAALYRYQKDHKSTALTPFLTNETVENGYGTLLDELFPFLNRVYNQVSEEDFFDYETEEEPKPISEKKAPQFDKYVEGQFYNGRPEGVWIAKDQFGKITSRVTFVAGELEGETQYYRTEMPMNDDFMDYDRLMKPELYYELPEKPVHYLQYVRHFHKGLESGPAYELNWLGDTLSYSNYVDNSRTGRSYERTKIAYSQSSYEDGYLNGIVQTYLTLPGKDSSLLYDLNFRNGALQGESKAYHLNGKLAKRGFFLSGEPIDDFEAYDTLGFKYQYVKFLYGQPVEEKIWEENELSVQYLLDWRDSIPFNAGDIAQSQSLESELSRLGVYGSGDMRPYYGRPSLLRKNGVKYEMTKYYPDNHIARHGVVNKGKKQGNWEYYGIDGKKMFTVNYFDTIITTPANVRFKSKGILTDYDTLGKAKSKSYIVERFEKYDCAHTDHLEERMLITIWERDTTLHRMNGHVKNYYENGVVQNEGVMKNGVATGVWKFYDPYGNLNKVGTYIDGKRDGRWLSGDLGNLKYMGDICLNPNLENLEEIMSYQERLLDITVIYYQKGIVRKTEYYGINANPEGPPEDEM